MQRGRQRKPQQRGQMTKGQRIGLIIGAAAVGVAFASASPAVLQMVFERASPPVSADLKPTYPGANNPANIAACGLLGAIVGGATVRVLQKIVSEWIERWQKMYRGDKINLFLSIFAGLFASTPVFLFLSSLQQTVYLPLAFFGFALALSTASYFTLRIMGDSLPWNRDRVPPKRTGIKILDTNVLIDGRIYDVARAGFVDGPIYVPQFILDELQYIADSHDPLRRQRGRRGLDVLRHLQADSVLEVGTQDRLIVDKDDEVDAKLVRLARAMGADIITNDFNLNRVASLQNVRVLNLNDLALALRPNVLPSEILTLALIREGNQVGQGVGYLEDGTMVVVEGGKPCIGETVDVVVTQVIQTERGKMIFGEMAAELEEMPPLENRSRRPHRKNP